MLTLKEGKTLLSQEPIAEVERGGLFDMEHGSEKGVLAIARLFLRDGANKGLARICRDLWVCAGVS